ncbi:macrolide ABC transporter ATP-binding protein [Candidatus Termititenax persephonae]|uniref:Macrolide ABC transporter ATP-binding protein n=1 Tax=Candidatus Termititenax persephonae TaxID=2218525 RepID=A0A388TI68_9BACT|nr:macrolide ABC transporter ATP-binding protein [Candidatus Termititenax persephonae]
MDTFITAQNLTKIYTRGAEKIYALNGATFSIARGAIVSVVGASGSGKTTLVNVLGCLDNPASGTLTVNGRQIFAGKLKLSETELTKIRREIFGYVFQKFFLLPTLTVKENILLPSVFQPRLRASGDRLAEILQLLGIAHRKDHLPGQLSGGEMQRVAIARALINNPSVLIADEPTGNLDSKRSEEIKSLLLDLNQKQNLTIILVTHNPELAKIGNQILELKDGTIQES